MAEVSVRDVVRPGMKVLHDIHGEGEVVSIADRKMPGRDMVIEMVDVKFPSGTVEWRHLISDTEADSGFEEDLVVSVPGQMLLTGEHWHQADDLSGMGGEMILEEIETRRTRTVISYDEGQENSSRRMVIKTLESASVGDIERCIESVCATVDWMVLSSQRRFMKLSPTKKLETVERVEESLGKDLWSRILYPSMSPEVQEWLGEVLVMIAQRLKTESSDKDLRASAARVVASIERRLEGIHGATISKNASEARSQRARRAATRGESA